MKQEEKQDTGNCLAIPGHMQRFYNTDIKFIARSKIYGKGICTYKQ